jgi:Ca-activated chloride channel family protein
MNRTLLLCERLKVCFSLLLILAAAAALCAFTAQAQSGRQKPASKPATSQPQRTPTTRPKRVNGTATVQDDSPIPAQKPVERTPNSPAELGEPPPFPTPKPTPTPAVAIKASDGEEVSPEDVVRVNSNLVTVPASVLDAQGRAVTDLKLEDFELRVDGQPRPISELGFADSPVRMAMLFDNSSSLVVAREFEKQAAARFFRRVLRPIDRAMLISVSTIPILEQPMTGDVQTLVRTIERFQKPEGATALFDAIVQAAHFLKPYNEGRKVIVIVSDGADTISDLDFDTTLKRALAADCQIYVVQTGYIENANLRDLAAERRMQEFAAQTGGAVYIPRTTGDLDYAFNQIAADLSQQYVLSYYPTEDHRDGRFRTINVRITTRPNLRVRARRGYYALPNQRQASFPQQMTTQPQEQTQFAAVKEQPASTGQNAGQPSGQSDQPSGTTNQELAATNVNSTYRSMDTGGGARDRVGPRGPTDEPDGGSAARAERPRRTYEPPPPQQTAPAASPSITPPTTAATLSTSTISSAPSSTPPPAISKPTPEVSRPAATTQPSIQPSGPARSKPGPAAEAQTTTSTKDSKPGEVKSEVKKPDEKTAPRAPVSGGVLNGKALSLPKPVYPAGAKVVGVTGTVVVEVLIDESGKVISARALSGPQMLQAASAEAARRAKFSPTILSGQPVKVIGRITYNFAK